MTEVLYDVTNLGLAFGTELTRTGIFRATEHFVREVLRHSELSPRFAAIDSYAGEVQLARFDRAAGGLLDGRTWRAWETAEATLEGSMELVDRLLALDELIAERRHLSAHLKLLNKTARPRSLTQQVDVYHSLRHPLVSRDRAAARVRVVTIHDMIPNLFPDLVPHRFVELHSAVVNSIDCERDWVICSSACTKDDICTITAMRPERVFVTPLAASPDVFHAERDPARIASVRERYGIRSADYVLSICTLEPRKNLTRLMQAFFALVEDQRWAEVQLVLVGPVGWQTESFFAAIPKLPGLRERVVLTGFVPDPDLSALYSGTRVFVFPSLYEGFGLPALEAMQCGVPVIASRAASLPEVVGDDALTVDPTDTDALAQAMTRILGDSGLAAELARRGRERSKEFTWSRTVQETIRSYDAMLAGSS